MTVHEESKQQQKMNKEMFMDLTVRYGLILLALYLPTHSVYAAAQKKLDINDLFKPTTTKTNLTNGTTATYTFSGATAGYINYIRLCKATDNSCGSCGAPYATYQILTSGNGMSYDTVGTQHSLQTSAIQSYLTTNGYPIASGPYFVGLYVQSQGLDCNSNHAYCSTNQDHDTGHILCVGVGTDGSLTREDSGNAVLSSNTTPYLFINNSASNTTTHCPAYASPFACVTTNNSGSTPSTPYGIAIDPPSQNVYVISRGNASNSLSCSISSTDGALTCSTASFASSLAGFSCTPQGIAIDPPGQNAYVTCGNNVYSCELGSPYTCTAISLSPALSAPTGIVIDPTNSYMYIANTGGSNMFACPIGGGTCTSGNAGNPTSYVTIDNTGTYIYTGKSTGSSVYSCSVTGTTINSCTGKSSGTTTVKGIALNPTGTNAYIAIQGGGGLINACPAAPGSGISSACTATGSSGTSTSMQGAAWGNVVGP